MRKQYIIVILAAGLLYGLILFWMLKLNDFQIDRFIRAGDVFVGRSQIHVLKNSYGYDGQFYYRLALDPFVHPEKPYRIALDQPALRHQRILYPLLSHLFSFGKENIIPNAMVIINFIGIITLGVLGFLWSKKFGILPALGVFIILYPGLLFSLYNNLTEIVAAVFGITALLFFYKKSYTVTGILMSLALFTRETSLIYLSGIFLYIALSSKQEKITFKKLLAFLIPGAVFSLWQIILYFKWNTIPLLLDSNLNITYPLHGFVKGISLWNPMLVPNVLGLLFILITLGITLFVFKRSKAPLFIKYSWLAGFLIFLLWGPVLWSEDLTFMRSFSELFFLSFVVIFGSTRKIIFLYSSVLISVFMLVFYLRFV